MTSSEQFGAHPVAGGPSFGSGDSPVSGGYPAGGYVPPVLPPELDTPPPSTEPPSTADLAKDQASSVAGGAADAAQHVAGVAKEQVGQVTAEASRQVKHLVGQARTELSSQAQSQQSRAATGLHSIGDQLQSMAQGSSQSGVATDLAVQASEKVHQVAGWLEQRDPAALLDEVRSFGRQRPGVFLAAALGAGVLAGRLARGMSTSPEKIDSGAQPAQVPPASPYRSTQPTVGYQSQPAALPPADLYAPGDLYATGDRYASDRPTEELGGLR